MINPNNLASFIESKLNQNQEGLVFKTFTIDHKLDRRYENKINYLPSIITNPQGSYMVKNEIKADEKKANEKM